MNSITKIKIGYFTDRFIEILSAAVQILFLQFLYYAFHRLSGYKTELCFLIFFAQIPLTFNTLMIKVYTTDNGTIYSNKTGRIIKKDMRIFQSVRFVGQRNPDFELINLCEKNTEQ